MAGGYCAKIFQIGLVATYGLLTASCAYTFERQWTRAHLAGAPELPVTDFSRSLRSCVATYDPDRLRDLDEGREYLTSGWFVDFDRMLPVIQCMKEHGWTAMPVNIYTP